MADSSLLFTILTVDKSTNILKKIGGSWGLLAVGVAAAAAGITAKTVSMAADFQSQMTRLVTSAGESEANLKTVSAGVLQLAGQVGDSTTELSKALYTIESGGQHGAAGLLVLKAAAQGAKAENADLTVVADAVTSVLQDYHLKASDAATVTSQLVAAVGAGKTTFQDLAGALHSVLPIASANHIALSDVSGALASMTVHGMSADQAAQNLADTIKHLAAPTGVQVKEFGQLGLTSNQVSDMLGKKGVTGTLQFLSQTILSKMGPSGKVLLSAFNQSKDAAHDAAVAFAALPKSLQSIATGFKTGKTSLGDWRKELKTLPPEQANLLAQWAAMQTNSTGFSNILKAGGPAAQTYSDALRRVTGDATGLNTALMLTGENTDYTNAAVAKIAGTTTEAGNNVKGWADIQKTFNQKMAEAKAGLGAFGVEIGTVLLPAFTKFVGMLAVGTAWLTKHQTIAKIVGGTLGILAVVLTSVIAGVKAWSVIQAVLDAELFANPIGLVILAVAGLTAVIITLWKRSSGFRDFWKIIWRDMVSFVLGELGYFITGAAKAFGWIPGLGPKLKSAAAEFNTFKNKANAALNDIHNKTVTVTVKLNPVTGYLPMGNGKPGQSSNFGPVGQHKAAGGLIGGSGWSWVGENGPELIRAPGAMVKSHGQSKSMASSSSSGSRTIVVEFHAAPGDQVAETIMGLIRPVVRGRYNGDVTFAMGGRQ